MNARFQDANLLLRIVRLKSGMGSWIEQIMNEHAFRFQNHDLRALGSGALWWPSEGLLCVSDLHLGKSDRRARTLGVLLPPYDGRETLSRLDAEIRRLAPKTVICLGDSFDDAVAAADIDDEVSLWIARLQAGRSWIWIAGNHDPGTAAPGGTHREGVTVEGIVFRHEAAADGVAEVSGHFHPMATLRSRAGRITRPCFLYDETRLILPAFGVYTGGLRCSAAPLRRLVSEHARAILTGELPVELPLSALV